MGIIMDNDLLKQIEQMLSPHNDLKCFDVELKQFYKGQYSNFLDTDGYLPSLFKTEKGYRSPVVVVLTSHWTTYGKVLGVCTGYAMITHDMINETTSHDIYAVYADSWHSSSGEEVVGWLPLPQFHHTNGTLTATSNPNSTYYFNYKITD